MPLTPDSDRLETGSDNAETAFEDFGTAMRDEIAEAITEQPIKSVLIALVAGIVIGRFVL